MPGRARSWADVKMIEEGTVYLVGAGPGDPELITVKGLSYLESADVVVHDRLVDGRLLARARDDAELIDAGKSPGNWRMAQERINATLIEKAAEGRSVVRLKGGDPFVFGRGADESEALAEAGVPFEIVPGVTSAVAAPAYAGIPVTRRGLASSVTFATGSEAPDKPGAEVEWAHLAKAGGTLVVLMGWENLEAIVRSQLDNGRSPDTPTALVAWGTEPFQRTVSSTLDKIVDRAKDADLGPPVVLVVGQVVGLREKLRWFDNRPLFGKRVLVTRTRSQAGELSAQLAARGAQPIEVATIGIEPLQNFSELDAEIAALASYDWVVFASTNAVDAVAGRLESLSSYARAFAGTKVAAVGPATEGALHRLGISPDFVPEKFVSEAIVVGLEGLGVRGKRVLLPRSDLGREVLPEGLAAAGVDVVQVTAYRNVVPADLPQRLRGVIAEGIDVATFTSSSTIKNLVSALDGDLDGLKGAAIACIGPITAAAARDAGLTVDVEASEYTIEGLVEAVAAHFAMETSSDG